MLFFIPVFFISLAGVLRSMELRNSGRMALTLKTALELASGDAGAAKEFEVT